jgi:hypothetical protein
MSSHRERKQWSKETERRVTWALVLVIGLAIAVLVLAWWRLRG